MKEGLLELREKYHPDRIIIETSGSAFPGKNQTNTATLLWHNARVNVVQLINQLLTSFSYIYVFACMLH